MKITNCPDQDYNTRMIAITIKHKIEKNEEKQPDIQNSYNKGYMEGYHDALVEILDFLNIRHDQKYYN